jgi:hypothetical protein
MFKDGDAAKPFGANVIISLSENNPVQMMAVILRCEVVKQPHVKCCTDGTELLHQCMIEAGKVFVIEGLNNWVGNDNRAGHNRISR